MDLTNQYGMDLLVANCPNCEKNSLYCGKIATKIKDLNNKEVLFCKQCKFVIAVDDYKTLLSSV